MGSQVQTVLHELERYLHDALGVSVKTTPWSGVGQLPPVLRERYRFAKAELLGLRALLVIDANPEEQSPATVRKHLDMLQSKQPAELIYVRARVTAYNRKRLIEQKVGTHFISRQAKNAYNLLFILVTRSEHHFYWTVVGSPSSEPAQEAFWKGKAEGVSDILRRIGRAAANWLLRGGDRRCLFD
jgi:hypothetical protein